MTASAPFLKATATLQVDHPIVRALADSVAAGNVSPCTLIGLMNAHVFGRLRKRVSATYSSALETLKAGYGDCGEHAVLLAALLRARGVPARVVTGLVWVPERKQYVGHAWVAVSHEGQWVFADPSYGRFPTASGLIPLLIDDEGASAMLVYRLLGRVSVEYERSGG